MTAAEVLAQHLWRGEILGCGCGWNWLEDRTYSCGEEERISIAHVEHQVDALKAAGYAVVELPKPYANWDGSMTAWPVTQSWMGEPYRDGEVNIRPSDGRIAGNGVSNPCDSPSDARSYAAALLAAADAAEVER